MISSVHLIDEAVERFVLNIGRSLHAPLHESPSKVAALAARKCNE
jgi:hypothetical protein